MTHKNILVAAMATTMLVGTTAVGLEGVTGIFSDVPANTFFTEPVANMHQLQVMSGYGDGRFGPHDVVTRAQLATTLDRFGHAVVDGYANKVATEKVLSKQLLVSSEWGQIGMGGAYAEFYEDGTFMTDFGAEGDRMDKRGTYKIIGDSVKLYYTEFYGLEREEAKALGFEGLDEVDILTFKNSSHNIAYGSYLERNGQIVYWNTNHRVGAGNTVMFEDAHMVVTVDDDLQVKDNAKAYSRIDAVPYSQYHFSEYNPVDCEDYCEIGINEIGYQAAHKPLARTQSKAMYNGQEDYWYVTLLEYYLLSTKIETQGEAVTNGYGEPLYVWVHGSDLEKR